MSKNKPNICVFIRTLKIGGAERQSMYLANVLSPYYNTYLLVIHGESIDDSFYDFIKQKNIKLVRLTGSTTQKIIKFYQFLKNQKIDLIFAYLTMNNVLGGILGRLAGVKYIVGGARGTEIEKYKTSMCKLIHNHVTNYTVFNSNAGRRVFENFGFNPAKSVVINNCFYLDELPRKNVVYDKPIIISVGRFEDVKDYETAVRTAHILKNEYNLNFEYKICGYGKNEAIIRNQIKKMNLEDCVSVYIKPGNLMELYRTSNIYLSTSLYEGFSNSIMEALSCSLPVVCTEVGDNNLLVRNNSNGFRHQVRDAESLAASVNKILDDPQLLELMGNSSYNVLKDNYTQEPFKEKYLELINKLISS